MNLATVSIVGNLVRPPEQMFFASGKTKTTLVVAVNNKYDKEKNDNADFYRVEAWGRLAELSANYLSKGNQVALSGRLTLEKWTDKEGRSRTTPTVRAEQIAFPGRARTPDDNVLPAPIGGELEFTEIGADKDGVVTDIKAAANAMMGRSVITASKSAEAAKAAPPTSLQAAGSRKTQTA